MTFDQAQFGRTLRNLRKDRNLSQQQLGDMLGITNVAISQFENAKTMPGAYTFVALADALSVNVALLLGDRLAQAEYAIGPVRGELRALGYDLALIPREGK